MSEVRVLSQGVTPDYEAFVRFMNREVADIQDKEPGTLELEIFANPETGRVVVHERYSDPDAFILHTASLMESDRLQEFIKLFELKRLTFLTEIDDERIATVARQFNATNVSQIAGFAR